MSRIIFCPLFSFTEKGVTSQHIFYNLKKKTEMSEKVKVCELCEEQPATVLCAECWKCYCDRCCKLVHEFSKKKGHKTEVIPKGVRVDAMCPLHKMNALELFCVDDIELCCMACL